ncbi:hypothetical protein [Olsenella uli]|uniref:hypothetical protein n=1 Tax=Olsenella uli TaxID=133926 RepID=UPI0024A8BC7B|nr:hypothetical protein [Olsenella uli]
MRVTIDGTASALEEESGSLSGKVGEAEEQISRMSSALQSPELAGEGYDAIRGVTRDLAVPAAKAYYVAFDAMGSACAADAQAVRGLPQSSAGVCDTDEFQRRIEAVQRDMESIQRRIAQSRASLSSPSGGSPGRSPGDAGASRDTAAYVSIQVDEALLRSAETERRGYEDDLRRAREYDEGSASTYASAQGAVSAMRSAASSVSSHLAGGGYGDTSWVAGADSAYSAVFGRRVEECGQRLYHDGALDGGALAGLLGGEGIAPSEAEALARVWGAHSGEEGVADAFAAAGSRDGQTTGAYAAFATRVMAGVYDANMRGADPDDRASEGEKKRTLQAMDGAFDRLFPSVGATAASYSMSVLLPNGVLYTRERSVSGDVGGDAPLSTEVRKDSHGRLVPGSLSFDLTGVEGAGGCTEYDGEHLWTGLEIKGSPAEGIEGTTRVVATVDISKSYSAVRAAATVSKDVGAASASVTDTETLEWGVKDPVTGVRLDGVLMPSASTSPAPSTHTNAVRLPDAQEVGEGAVVVGGTVVVGVVAYKALKALAGFALAGPPGALAGALAP